MVSGGSRGVLGLLYRGLRAFDVDTKAQEGSRRLLHRGLHRFDVGTNPGGGYGPGAVDMRITPV